MFPSVFRKNTSDFYLGSLKQLNSCSVDGVVVKSLDAAWFVHRSAADANDPDQGLYTYNHRAQEMLREFHPVHDDTLRIKPWRTEKEDNADSEVVLYGYLPLMTSAQCVHANTGKMIRHL